MPHSQTPPVHVTMRDVAKRAGVSAQTVSNVVNGRSDRVGEQTAQRVVDAINGLGYRLNQSARSLRRGRTGIVGLGIPLLASEYYGELADRLADRFAERGLRLAVEKTGGALDAEIESLAATRLESYDGYILAIAASEAADLDRLPPAKPIVLLGERAISARFDHVLMDNVGGAKAATAHLIERGARSIVALGGSRSPGDSVQTLRTQGYLEAHAEAGVPMDPRRIVPGGLDIADGHAAIGRLLDEDRGGFDAVFALTDSCALGALRALSERGVRVPHEVQVIGFDNVKAGRFSSPSLSTVEPGNDDMADRIARTLVRRLDGGGAGSPTTYTAPVRVIERESTRSPTPAADGRPRSAPDRAVHDAPDQPASDEHQHDQQRQRGEE